MRFDNDEGFNEYSDEPPEDENFLTKSEILHTMELDYLETKLTYDVSLFAFNKATEIARNSWFWRFRSPEKRTARIIRIYNRIVKAIAIATNSNNG